MNCRNCGGAMTRAYGRGHFQCPYCDALAFLDETDAGGGAEIAWLDTASPRVCPVCDAALANALLHQVAVEACRTCRGVLLPRSEFASLVRRLRATSERSDEPIAPIAPEELRRQSLCPECRKSMETHPYFGPGAVVIDSCARCHLIWLDHGELAAIRTAPGR